MTWDPTQYNRFAAERSQPFWDLAALVEPRPGMQVVDLGCGPGQLTAELHARLAAASTLGVDSSDAMLDAARAHSGGGVEFARGDLAEFAPTAPLDLVFSNAAFQWVDDHPALFAHVTSCLAPGGQLAVQMPMNHDAPAHKAAFALAAEAPFAQHLEDWEPHFPRLPLEGYAELLFALGFERQHVRAQVYGHVLESRDAVLEWSSGTLLTAVRSRLPAELYDLFVERYSAALAEALPDSRPFFFPFKRLLMWGALPA